MADNNITQILAALASQSGSSGSPLPGQQAPPPAGQVPPGVPPHYLGSYASPQPPPGGSYALPPPKSSGAVDLSSIRPSNSGSVSLGGVNVQDAINKARGLTSSKGYDSGRDSRGRVDSYRRSRSRSRSPGRFRDAYSYGSLRDERRDERRYPRDRSASPRRDGVPSGADPGHEVLAIESSLVGLIIGQQGKNLRRVEQETSARVQFLTGPESSGPTRQCKISGSFQAREGAKAEIRRIISENGNPVRGSLAVDNRDRSRQQHQQQQQQYQQPQQHQLPPQQQFHQQQQSQQQQQQQQQQQKGGQSGRQEDALQIMVPNRTVGLIIGRGGETIKDLQERSGCHVNILGEEHSVNGLRPVNLIGPAHSQQEAKNMIMEVVDSDNKNMATGANVGRPGSERSGLMPQPGDGGKLDDTIYVPSDAVGMIIGKGGETIKEMQNVSSCKINVSQPSGRDVQREIGLVGTRAAIESAKGLIMEKVRAVEDKNRGGRRDQSGGAGAGGGGGYDSYSQPQPQQQQSQQQLQTSYGGYSQPVQGYQQQQTGAAQSSSEDVYAAYGGYQNYLQMWYAAAAQQQQQQGQTGHPPSGGAPPPS